jgi:hypothetical protein
MCAWFARLSYTVPIWLGRCDGWSLGDFIAAMIVSLKSMKGPQMTIRLPLPVLARPR